MSGKNEIKWVDVAPITADHSQIGGNHYTSKRVQPWAAMEAWMTPEQFSGFLRGNVIKYLARADNLNLEGKGGIEDLRKARHYLDKLIEFGCDAS